MKLQIENCRLKIENLKFAIFNLQFSIFLTALLCLTAIAGCGYMVGAPYDPEIRSVYVPVFGTESDRRGFEFLLTEAVQKEIQDRSHFRLAKPPYADTQLTGRIVQIRKDVVGETEFDDPRELQLSIFIEVTWQDLRHGTILCQEQIPLAPEIVQLRGQAEFAPEVGQSLATASTQATDRLARQIVNMMESPW